MPYCAVHPPATRPGDSPAIPSPRSARHAICIPTAGANEHGDIPTAVFSYGDSATIQQHRTAQSACQTHSQIDGVQMAHPVVHFSGALEPDLLALAVSLYFLPAAAKLALRWWAFSSFVLMDNGKGSMFMPSARNSSC